jgi:beta-N-acetylglucosaminidase
LAIVALIVVSFLPLSSSAKNSLAVSSDETLSVDTSSINFEINRKALNMQSIISENSNFEKMKEQVVEERTIEYETTINQNSSLPKGEEVVVQEGADGSESVSLVKTYENGELIEEIILAKETINEPVEKIVDMGTSEFLANLNVHIGDTLYLKATTNLMETTDTSSAVKAEINQSLDVTLLELVDENLCKVSFDGVEGYLPTSSLTSSYVTPNIVEKNRIQKLLLKVNINMELNKSSGLTLNDYKTIFTGLSNDIYGVFESNYQVFYNMDKQYNINGIFLAALAIHESSWGTSEIAQDKKNLFGYGSYDETPYSSSFEFETYEEGIETVAKSLVKYYINPVGTKIYDGETASAWYYNGPTLEGVNTRYASDSTWYTKVYSYMETLYNRLK